MKYMDLANASGMLRQRMLTRLHDSGLGKYLVIDDKEFLEELDCLSNDQLCVSHPVIEAPFCVASGASVYPVGYIEMETPIDIYSVIRVWFNASAESNPRDFQLLVVPDESLELIAYSTVCGIDGRAARIDLQIDNAPNQGMPASMAVNSGQFINPPQGAASVPASAVIGLRAFNSAANPIGNPIGIVRGEIAAESAQRVGNPSGIWRRVHLGFLDKEFVHQPVEGGTQKVQPFSEDHGELDWNGCGRLQVEGTTVIASYSSSLNRIGLQVFSTDSPELISVRSSALYSSDESPEFIFTHGGNRIDDG